jgi:hypothetical protein
LSHWQRSVSVIMCQPFKHIRCSVFDVNVFLKVI